MTEAFADKPLPLEFAAGSIRGVRSFALDKLGRLTGIHHKQIWLPGENVAKCNAKPGGKATKAMTAFSQYPELGARRYAEIQGLAPPPRNEFTRKAIRRPGWLSGGLLDLDLDYTRDWGRDHEDDKLVIDWLQEQIKQEPKEHDFATCKCGFYAFFDGSDEYSNMDRENSYARMVQSMWTTSSSTKAVSARNDSYAPVSAVIEAYGETLIGEKGFRASKAKILALRLDPKHLGTMQIRKLKRNYPDAAVFGDTDSMLEIYPPSDELGITPSNTADFWERTA